MLDRNRNILISAVKQQQKNLYSCIFFSPASSSGCSTPKQMNKQFESYRECILYHLSPQKCIYCSKWLDSCLCAMGTEFLP